MTSAIVDGFGFGLAMALTFGGPFFLILVGCAVNNLAKGYRAKWEGEWEVRKPKEPDKPEESVSMFDPKGILFAVREDEVEELIAKGWTRELVKPS